MPPRRVDKSFGVLEADVTVALTAAASCADGDTCVPAYNVLCGSLGDCSIATNATADLGELEMAQDACKAAGCAQAVDCDCQVADVATCVDGQCVPQYE